MKKLKHCAARKLLLVHHRVYIPFSNSYSPVNYLHDIKPNPASHSLFAHPTSHLPFVMDDVYTGRSWGADVGEQCTLDTLNESLGKDATSGLCG